MTAPRGPAQAGGGLGTTGPRARCRRTGPCHPPASSACGPGLLLAWLRGPTWHCWCDHTPLLCTPDGRSGRALSHWAYLGGVACIYSVPLAAAEGE